METNKIPCQEILMDYLDRETLETVNGNILSEMLFPSLIIVILAIKSSRQPAGM